MVDVVSRLRGSVERRIRVLVVRRRLEEHSAALVEALTGQRPPSHTRIRSRLLLLAVGRSPDAVRAAHGLARRAGSVYAETSSILHSRRAFGDVEEVLVREWEGVADEVDQALERRVEPG